MKIVLLALKLFVLVLLATSSSNIEFNLTLLEQEDAIIIDADFNEYSLDSIISKHPYTIVVTRKSCRGCVEFLIQTETIQNVLYLLDNLSFTEIATCSKSFEKRNANLFFTTELSLNNLISTNDISPLLLSSDFKIIAYEELKEISNNFSKSDFVKKLR
ncbi:MAG: hypothetical protein JJT77_13980 [Crocinitomicaceae bacterium]|nr:hypothetical protein [Crocinitomicaceae bacterium]